MKEITIKEYSDAVKGSFASLTSQGKFMREVFTAAGSNRFPTKSDEEYTKKICNGSKPITDDMVSSFPKPFDVQGITEYFQRNVSDLKLKNLAEFFETKTEDINKEHLLKAIAAQFFLYVEGGGQDKAEENQVPVTYQRLLDGTIDENVLGFPLYSGDRAWVINGQRVRAYTKGFYEKFKHVWDIRNNGKVSWSGRKLICKSESSQYIKLDKLELDIPETEPGGRFEITVDVDSRGKEGTFETMWEMIDSNGNDCFPDDKKQFAFTVTVINKSRRATEAK